MFKQLPFFQGLQARPLGWHMGPFFTFSGPHPGHSRIRRVNQPRYQDKKETQPASCAAPSFYPAYMVCAAGPGRLPVGCVISGTRSQEPI